MSLRIACLGPEGTVSHEALLTVADAQEVEVMLEPSIHRAVSSVRAGESDFALVPLENSLEGGVAETLDELLAGAGVLPIAGELLHPVRHNLIATTQLPLNSITAVHSKPEALAQCSHFLRERLPGARKVAAASTSDAVRSLSASNEPIAAIGTHLAADIYGAVILEEDVGRPDNLTRFIWLAAEQSEALPPGCDPAQPMRTSIIFWGSGTNEPGWLVDCLAEFGDRGVNLTRIESRPRRDGLGSYVFFADLEGSADSPQVSDALAGLRTRTDELRLLGSYPSSPRPTAS
ncbi:MAG: prephenate dehydratase [Actinomycetes bacterium]